MLELSRARQIFVAAFFGSIALLALEFPLHTLLNQRSQISQVASELSTVRSHNVALNSDISSLSKSSRIASIAHEEYGLVKPGQRSYVILPAAGSKGSTNSLGAGAVPLSDIGPTAASPTASTSVSSPSQPSGSLLSRVVHRLEFWR